MLQSYVSECVCALTFPAMWAHCGVVVFTKVNVVSMGFYILPTNIAIYKYVCMYQYRGTNYKIHAFFFSLKKNYGTISISKNGTKDSILSIHKTGLLGGLARFWFSSLYRIGKLWGVCVCAFVWKSVCIRIISCLLFIPYVWYRTLACRFHFYSCLGLAEDAHWHDVIGLEGQWNILQVLIRCILLQTVFFLQFSLPPITFASTKHK